MLNLQPKKKVGTVNVQCPNQVYDRVLLLDVTRPTAGRERESRRTNDQKRSNKENACRPGGRRWYRKHASDGCPEGRGSTDSGGILLPV